VAERCDSCRLWRRLTAESGECHALAPHPVLYLNIPGDTPGPPPGVPATAQPLAGLRVAWPRTCPADFCGEWSPLAVRPQEGGQEP
jgi:hypothetical protein